MEHVAFMPQILRQLRRVEPGRDEILVVRNIERVVATHVETIRQSGKLGKLVIQRLHAGQFPHIVLVLIRLKPRFLF